MIRELKKVFFQIEKVLIDQQQKKSINKTIFLHFIEMTEGIEMGRRFKILHTLIINLNLYKSGV